MTRSRTKQPMAGNGKATANFLSRRLRVAPRKSKLRYAAIDDQFRSGHEGGIVAREEQGCLSDFPGLAETMKRDLILDRRGRFVELLLGKSELAVKRRADRAGTFTRMPRGANSVQPPHPTPAQYQRAVLISASRWRTGDHPLKRIVSSRRRSVARPCVGGSVERPAPHRASSARSGSSRPAGPGHCRAAEGECGARRKAMLS